MPRNSKKTKQRALDLESSEVTVISNLAANEDNSTQMDKLKVLQEMFDNRIDSDIVEDVFQECAGNVDQTLESLLELCASAQYLPNEPPLPPQSFGASEHVITEVPHIVSEPPITESTNSNREDSTKSTIKDSTVEVLNLLPINAKPTHISPLNAVMPFASLFAPKNNHSFNNCLKTSHSSKPKEFGLKDELKEKIKSAVEKMLILMRGLPGSGKTTLANYLVSGSNGIILSTDDYFIRNGVYRYEPSQLPSAHEWNQNRAKKYIQRGRSPIIIDNTNLEGWEMKPYVSLGYTEGYKIYFLEPETHWSRNPKELSKRNIHGIPKEKLEKMVEKFEKVTVEDLSKTLINNHLLLKSKSEEKIPKSKLSTNQTKPMVLRSSSTPSAAINININGSFDESSHSSAQIEDMSTNSQIESSSSPNSTEPTSPAADNRIDIDLLLALSQRSADSEDCSSINASDGGSSCVSQEWERDDEFTYAHNRQNYDSNNGHKSSESGVKEVNNENKLNAESDPKIQREYKQKDIKNINKSVCIEEENPDDIELDETNQDLPNKLNSNSNGNNSSDLSSSVNNKRLFGLVGVRKLNNWEFPPFPINDSNNMVSNTCEISITYLSRQTQTERKDWALLELKQRNNDSNEGLETEIVDKEEKPIRTKVDPNRNILKVKLDKGTVTSDVPNDQTRDQKLNTLKQKFPKAEHNHLNQILDACLEDDKWAEKLLSELNDDHFDVGSLEQMPTGSESNTASPEITAEFTEAIIEEDEPLGLLVDQKSSDEPQFVLTLEPTLAAQLQSHFGALIDKTSLSSEDLTITLSHGVARLLHHNWKKSLNQKPLTQSSSKPSISNNINNLTNNKSKELVLKDFTPKSELQEIMDLELAKELSAKEYADSLASEASNSALCPTKREMAKNLLATKLKRDQLYQRYPGVDQSFLDGIFETHRYCLGKTIDFLDNSLGLSDDFSTEMEALIADERYDSPLSGGSRSPSPSKSVRKTIDLNSILSQMNALLANKKEYHDKARLAYQRKMYAVASYYGDEAIQFQSQIARLSKEVVDYILNTCANSNELDLHGLHILEVNSILSEYLRRKSEELKKSIGKRKLIIDIITGYGATKGVQGRIKPTVIQYLKQKNYTYEIVNMGVIRVTLIQQI